MLYGAFAFSFATICVRFGQSIGIIRSLTFAKAFATLVLIEAFVGLSQTLRDLPLKLLTQLTNG